ncbi:MULTISPECIES: ABC transporter permease [Streptomyces]|uniref:BldKA-like ABC transporter n=1 Tax=Streptomyces albus (strain ATCC 21838 / DSM 41398 / FERM P-419 / JCM 4703 / NBRC 107858) TaxID=1081613 RepID=A0A0B5ELZ8_STRA4|nr:ABC transporter permease [Streptomyces sp. SCSIO ZS0520]AJE82604.1 BldKA-like ABC transporter [Streptomyces albus]AOU76918.1 BldKA-like ABC transporter [Streptomyces albus]AYN32696.1 ABC transporter permease [Streptomyces albus]
MTSPIEIKGTEAPVLDKAPDPKAAPEEKKLEGRSPGQLMWRRFKRDKAGVISACIVLFFFVVAAAAPLIAKVYGKNPYTLYAQDDPTLFDEFNFPAGANGGISGDFWFGIEPKLGRDVFTQLLYGMRTSLYTALLATLLMVLTGVLIGIVGGYMGGKVDYWLGRITDFLLAFPSQLFFVASMPVITTIFVAPDEATPTYVKACAIMGVLWFLGWMGLARLIRAVTLSLREREFVEAAKVAGASPWRIIRKELLPNLVTPILVQGTYMLPSTILSVAFLSFVGVGYDATTPDWGRMFATGSEIYEQDPTFMLFPGVAMVVFVVAFNLLGDSVRDAFDPKTGR